MLWSLLVVAYWSGHAQLSLFSSHAGKHTTVLSWFKLIAWDNLLNHYWPRCLYIFLPCSYSSSIVGWCSWTCQNPSTISLNLDAFIKLLSQLKKLPHLPAHCWAQLRHHKSQSKYSETFTSVQCQDFYWANLSYFALPQTLTRVTDVGWQCLKLLQLLCIYDYDLRLNDHLIFSFSEEQKWEGLKWTCVINWRKSVLPF